MTLEPTSPVAGPPASPERDQLGWSGRLWSNLVPGVALGLAGTFVAVTAQRVPAAATLLPLAFLAIVCMIGFAVSAWSRRADWWMATLIVILAVFPNSSIIQDLRIVSGGFRIFTRMVLGAASLWDLLLALLVVLALWMHARGESQPRAAGRSADVFLLGIALICGAGVMNGLIHALILRYGPTSFRSVVQQSLPVFYLFASVVVGRLAIRDSSSVWKVIWAVRLSTVAVLVQGVFLLVLTLRGDFPAMKGFLGIPIVLYDQLTVLAVTVCLTVARYVGGLKLKLGDWVLLVGSVLFLLLSTRRLVLVMLVFNVVFVFVLAVRRGHVFGSLVRVIGGGVAVAAVVVALAAVAVPRFVEAIGLVLSSIDVTSDVGVAYKGDLRLAEWQNLVRNLGPSLSPTWAFGRGLGTYWQEFVPMGLSLQEGSTAFAEGTLEAGAQGWWPGFHLPFVTLLYRFGVLGTLAIWGLALGWVLRWRTLIRGLAEADKAFAVMVVVLTASQLLGIGETLDSQGPAFQGFLVAGLWGLRSAGPARSLEVGDGDVPQ